MADRRTPVPAVPNVPARVGIIQASNAGDVSDPLWEQGFAWESEACDGGGIYDPCDDDLDLEILAAAVAQGYEPFVVWAGERCTTMGYDSRDWVGRARRLLEATESKRIGRELWRGDLARARSLENRYLASSTALELTAAPQAPADVLAVLEQGLADCLPSGVGMIHATRQLVSLWDTLGALQFGGGQITTILGTRVVADPGYDGSGPGAGPGDAPVAAGPGSVWAYGTGVVVTRRGPITTEPRSLQAAQELARATDRSINSIEVRAERPVAATWDGCCLVAAEADIDPPVSGGS